MSITIFKPVESRFAVIRIDPVASVAHLNDPEATEAAKALESKCYLVYISVVRLLFIIQCDLVAWNFVGLLVP